MSLPDCKDICGEEPSATGFCPVDYYVPKAAKGNFGLIAGCIWGDDLAMKLQYLDLTRIKEGLLDRKESFGYWDLPNGYLKDIIEDQFLDDDDDDSCLLVPRLTYVFLNRIDKSIGSQLYYSYCYMTNEAKQEFDRLYKEKK